MDSKIISSSICKAKNIYKLELYLWAFLACIFFIPVICDLCIGYYYTNNYIYNFIYSGVFLSEYYNNFIVGVLIIIFPILFKLVFGKLPLEYIKEKQENVILINESTKDSISLKVVESTKFDNSFRRYIVESEHISERIFTRAGVYLFVGCLIAFVGITVFSISYVPTPSQDLNLAQRLLDYLPRFGALFFIEFIAFFFLKQYRIMIEEYRYYEAIKRKRQDNLCLMELVEKHHDNPELLKDLIKIIKQDAVSKLQSGESTENLEVQKILNQEMDIFSKMTELIKAVKSK